MSSGALLPLETALRLGLLQLMERPLRAKALRCLLQGEVLDQAHAPARLAAQGFLCGVGVQPEEDGLALDHGLNLPAGVLVVKRGDGFASALTSP